MNSLGWGCVDFPCYVSHSVALVMELRVLDGRFVLFSFVFKDLS